MRTFQRSRVSRSTTAGFSLAELMVVIVILGLLATLVVPNVMRQLFTANREIAKTNINSICQAITNYAIENGGKYPERIEDLIVQDASGKAYLSGYTSAPRDPWNNEFKYEPPQGTQDFKVISYGKDGAPGGEGDDADIDSSTMKEGKQK
jgi:general secretion pathway protein G